MKKRIVIVDDDEKYIANLELILLTREEDLIDLEVVTGEYFQEYFSQSRNIDCLIINEKYYTSVVQKQKFEFVQAKTEFKKEEPFVSYKIDNKDSVGIFTLNECNFNQEYCDAVNNFFADVAKNNVKM